MGSRLVQGALAAALIAFAVAALAWAIHVFVESVILANIIIDSMTDLSPIGEYAISLVVVSVVGAVAYLLFKALLQRARGASEPPEE